jgi:replicative DNA helicase
MPELPSPLTPEEIVARLEGASSSDHGEGVPDYKYIEPTSTAFDSFVDYVRNDEGRFLLGFPEVDLAMRGLARGEMLLVVGHSHNGKSQVLYNSIVTALLNTDAHILLFSPDEPRELVAQKLHCIAYGRNGEELEQQIKDGNEAVLEEVRSASRSLFDRILINDGALTFTQMSDTLKEAQDYWGRHPNFAMVDYLELQPGESDHTGVVAKAQGLKRWSKEASIPLAVVHQAGRGSGDRHKPALITAGKYGGEQEALAVLGVYRKRDDPSLSYLEKCYHSVSINVRVTKNKRPPNKLGDFEYFLCPHTGQIRPYRDDDIPPDDRYMR